MRLSVRATLCGRLKTTTGKWQLIIKISSTLRGEDKGEGGINYFADCLLLIADWIKQKNNQQAAKSNQQFK